MNEFITVNGIKFCYEIQGIGEPVILVHGFGAKKETWHGLFNPLSEKFKVIRFDNRGAGKSDRPNEPFTMNMFVEDIKGLMDALAIEKAHIIGWSLGGMIVQHFLLKYPERVNKAVLLLTNYKGQGVDLYKQSRHEGLDVLLEDPEKAFWDAVTLNYHRSFKKKMKEDPKKKFYGLWSVEDLIEESAIDPATHADIDNQASALEDHNTLDRLHEVQIETLLIAGSHDRVCPKSTMEEMAMRMPNSTLKVIDKAGHAAPNSRAPEVNELIIDFLLKPTVEVLESLE
jgi:pimeloyl-ACP methyl ester carboxylesterase